MKPSPKQREVLTVLAHEGAGLYVDWHRGNPVRHIFLLPYAPPRNIKISSTYQMTFYTPWSDRIAETVDRMTFHVLWREGWIEQHGSISLLPRYVITEKGRKALEEQPE